MRHPVACSPSSSIRPLSIPGLVFFLIQLELRRHPTNLAYMSSRLRLTNRPKNIRIHLAVSRVRFYLLRFNSSGNFCGGGAICSRELPIRICTTSFRVCGIGRGSVAAVQMRLTKLDLLFVTNDRRSRRTRTDSPSSVAIWRSGRREV